MWAKVKGIMDEQEFNILLYLKEVGFYGYNSCHIWIGENHTQEILSEDKGNVFTAVSNSFSRFICLKCEDCGYRCHKTHKVVLFNYYVRVWGKRFALDSKNASNDTNLVSIKYMFELMIQTSSWMPKRQNTEQSRLRFRRYIRRMPFLIFCVPANMAWIFEIIRNNLFIALLFSSNYSISLRTAECGQRLNVTCAQFRFRNWKSVSNSVVLAFTGSRHSTAHSNPKLMAYLRSENAEATNSLELIHQVVVSKRYLRVRCMLKRFQTQINWMLIAHP